MIFNSPLFLFLFLPFFFSIYFAADKNIRRIIGLIGSFVFFSWGQMIYIPLMAGIILWNYWIGQGLGKTEKEKRSKKLLWLGITVNLVLLAAFKYLTTYGVDWFLAAGFSKSFTDFLDELSFPLGLSYITFQTISYLVDVYNSRIDSESNLLNFALYVMLFPKLLVGPITRYKTVASSLSAPETNKEDVANGIRRFIQGFAKKILIADILATLVNAAFRLGAESLLPHIAWLAIIAYSLQIYFDFSGYTDMALGLGMMMGFRFEENFNFPYISQSIGEFWRRWHISLSTWFRDYVFYPLERKRLKFIGRQLNIMIVFLLTGLWHGITQTFILWGVLHGVFLVIENLFLGRALKKAFRPIRHIYTLTSILLTWIIFRSPSIQFAWDFILRLLGLYETYTQPTFSHAPPLPFIEPSFLLAFFSGLLLSLPIVPYLEKTLSVYTEESPKIYLPLRIFKDGILFILFVMSLAMMAGSKFNPGIYGGF